MAFSLVMISLAGCAPERQEPATVTAVPVTASPPPSNVPPWASSDVEADGFIFASGSAESPDEAIAHARAELAQIRQVRIRSLVESASAEIARGDASGSAAKTVQAVRSHAEAVLVSSEVVRRESVGNRWWAQVRIPVEVLLPERRLVAILAAPPGKSRRNALGEEALRSLGGDAYRRDLALIAARLAVADDGGAAELVTLARVHFELGRHEAAMQQLDAASAVIEGQPQAVFERFAALEAQLLATALSATAIATQLREFGQGIAKQGALRVVAKPLPDGWQADFTLRGAPVLLIGIWIDGEDLAPIVIPGAEKPITGTWSAAFTWPAPPVPDHGSIIVLALAPGHPAATRLAALRGLSLVRANAEADLAAWRACFGRLAAQPPSTGFILDLKR